VAALGLLAVAGLVLFLVTRGGHETPTVTAIESPRVSTVEPGAQVRVNIRATPGDALMVLDGKTLGDNPHIEQRARDGAVHLLEVSAPGYAARSLDVRFDQDVNLDIQLNRTDGTAPAAGRTPSLPVDPRIPAHKAGAATRPPAKGATKADVR